LYFMLLAMLAIALMAIVVLYEKLRGVVNKTIADKALAVNRLFILSTGVYLFLSFLVRGRYRHPLEQYLYILNLVVVLLLIPRLHDPFEIRNDRPRRWFALTGILILALGLLAAIAINMHGALPGSHQRFP
jgi:cell division protein FtsW (lipid II flippase)